MTSKSTQGLSPLQRPRSAMPTKPLAGERRKGDRAARTSSLNTSNRKPKETRLMIPSRTTGTISQPEKLRLNLQRRTPSDTLPLSRESSIQALKTANARRIAGPDLFSEEILQEETVTRTAFMQSSSVWQTHSAVSTVRTDIGDTQDEISRANLYGHGCFQRMVLFCSVLSSVVLHCHSRAFTLIARGVEHWCKRPEGFQHLSTADWKNVGIPIEHDGSYSRCKVYDRPLDYANRTEVPCTAWEYETTQRTIISTWDLVCNREWLLTYASVVYMIGAVIAVPTMGLAADQIGRRPVTCMAVSILLLIGPGTCFATNFHFFVCVRCGVSGCVSTIFVIILILLFEVTSHNQRVLYVVIAATFGHVITSILLNVLGHLHMRWRALQFTIMVISILLVCTFYCIEESPRWLLTTWKFKRGEEAVLWAAKMNGEHLETVRYNYWKLKQKLMNKEDFEAAKMSPTLLFSNPILRRRCGFLYACWFAVMFAFYGLIVSDIGEPEQWAIFVTMFSPAPLNTIAYFAINTVGRKIVYIVCLGLLGCSSAALMTSYTSPFISNVFFVVAKGAVDVALVVNFIYTSELFPTVLRSIGVCCAYLCGRVGAATASAVMSRSSIAPENYSMGVVALLVVVSELALLGLPETLSRPLANTVKKLEAGGFRKHLQDTLPMDIGRTTVKTTKSQRQPPAPVADPVGSKCRTASAVSMSKGASETSLMSLKGRKWRSASGFTVGFERNVVFRGILLQKPKDIFIYAVAEVDAREYGKINKARLPNLMNTSN
ncbi:organic anion transporter 3-like [Ornithodoros turicata]|uniref:organic anion transporter 3-like n=1 Tax=Ornithodoros turicata TaxID=34597 RepID=UPI003138D56E